MRSSLLAQQEKLAGDCQTAAQYIPPTTRQQLEQQKFMLEKQLRQVVDALNALDTNPQLESFIETLRKAGV